MQNDVKRFLLGIFDAEIVEQLKQNYSATMEEMCREQKARLSPTQYKNAKNSILVRVALYLSLKEHVGAEEALVHTKAYFYGKVDIASKIMKFVSKSDLGFALFRKAFSTGLKADTWTSKITRNDRKVFTFDITKCLYKDLCDFYECPELCPMFCDGDWIMFRDMVKIKFERSCTLGYGDELCDFKFTRRLGS